jgi:putative heme iron utilization protein
MHALRIAAWVLAALFLGTELVLAVLDPPHGTLCANQRVRSRVQWELERQPDLPLAVLAEEIHGSWAQVLDAMPENRRIGVPGAALPAVWRSASNWPDPVIVAWSQAHVFHIHGPLSLSADPAAGGFDFKAAAGAVTGDLRPSEIWAIYAYKAQAGEHEMPELLFLDRRGALIFEIVPGATLEKPPRRMPAEFTSTFLQMKQMARPCE